MDRASEIKIFRKVVGTNRIVTSDHVNVSHGNRISDGYFNQGVSKAKLREHIKKENIKYDYWKSL